MQRKNSLHLGIDLGLANLGFSLIKEKKLICYGVILTKKENDHAKRLEVIYQELEKIIDYYKPNLILVENIFHGKNSKTFINISNVQGVVFLLIGQKNINYLKINPNQAKKNLTQRVSANKKEMVQEIRDEFKINENILDDIADAIAISMCSNL